MNKEKQLNDNEGELIRNNSNMFPQSFHDFNNVFARWKAHYSHTGKLKTFNDRIYISASLTLWETNYPYFEIIKDLLFTTTPSRR